MDPQLSPRVDKLIIAAEQAQASKVKVETPMSAEEFLRNKDNIAGIPSAAAHARMNGASAALLHVAFSAWPSRCHLCNHGPYSANYILCLNPT